jgi:hypothetical protein
MSTENKRDSSRDDDEHAVVSNWSSTDSAHKQSGSQSNLALKETTSTSSSTEDEKQMSTNPNNPNSRHSAFGSTESVIAAASVLLQMSPRSRTLRMQNLRSRYLHQARSPREECVIKHYRSQNDTAVQGDQTAKLRQSLEAASVVLQEENGFAEAYRKNSPETTISSSNSSSTRSALSQNELDAVARRATHMAQHTFDYAPDQTTRASRMQGSMLYQMLKEKRARKYGLHDSVVNGSNSLSSGENPPCKTTILITDLPTNDTSEERRAPLSTSRHIVAQLAEPTAVASRKHHQQHNNNEEKVSSIVNLDESICHELQEPISETTGHHHDSGSCVASNQNQSMPISMSPSFVHEIHAPEDDSTSIVSSAVLSSSQGIHPVFGYSATSTNQYRKKRGAPEWQQQQKVREDEQNHVNGGQHYLNVVGATTLNSDINAYSPVYRNVSQVNSYCIQTSKVANCKDEEKKVVSSSPAFDDESPKEILVQKTGAITTLTPEYNTGAQLFRQTAGLPVPKPKGIPPFRNKSTFADVQRYLEVARNENRHAADTLPEYGGRPIPGRPSLSHSPRSKSETERTNSCLDWEDIEDQPAPSREELSKSADSDSHGSLECEVPETFLSDTTSDTEESRQRLFSLRSTAQLPSHEEMQIQEQSHFELQSGTGQSLLIGEGVPQEKSAEDESHLIWLETSGSISTIETESKASSNTFQSESPSLRDKTVNLSVTDFSMSKPQEINDLTFSSAGGSNNLRESYPIRQIGNAAMQHTDKHESSPSLEKMLPGAETLRWWQQTYGSKASGGTNDVVNQFLSKSMPAIVSSKTKQGPTELLYSAVGKATISLPDDEDDDVFFGLEEGSDQHQSQDFRPADSLEDVEDGIETSPVASALADLNVPRNESGNGNHLLVPPLLQERGDIIQPKTPNRTFLLSNHMLSSLLQDGSTSNSESQLPTSDEEDSRLLYTIRNYFDQVETHEVGHSSRNSKGGLRLKNSDNPVASEITASIVAGKSRKEHWSQNENFHTIQEETNEEDDEGEADGIEIPGRSAPQERDLAADKVPNIEDLRQSIPRQQIARNLFLNLGCSLVDSISNVFRIEADFPSRPQCLMRTGAACNGVSDRDDDSRIDYEDEDAEERSFFSENHSPRSTLQQESEPTYQALMEQNPVNLNDIEQRIWHEWEQRDDQSLETETNQRDTFDLSSLDSSQIHVKNVTKSPATLSSIRNQPLFSRSRTDQTDQSAFSPTGANVIGPVPRCLAPSYTEIQESILLKLKQKGIFVLKLNRAGRWQHRYFAISSCELSLSSKKIDGECLDGHYPRALLWLKRFSQQKLNQATANLSRHCGRGGLLFENLHEVLRSPAPDPSLPKRFLKIFPNSSMISIDYKFNNGRRIVKFAFQSSLEAQKFAMTTMMVRDVINRAKNSVTCDTALDEPIKIFKNHAVSEKGTITIDDESLLDSITESHRPRVLKLLNEFHLAEN